MKRKTLSKKARFELFKRDGFTCAYCGAHPPAVVLVIDHIVPVAKGGSNDSDNLITACEPCNQGKGARSLSAVPVSLAEKAALVAEKEAQLRGYHKIMEKRRKRIEDEAWQVASIFMDCFGLDSIKRDYLQSIRYFNDRMGVHEVMEAMDSATAKMRSETSCFRYFCGICWNIIRGAA